MKIEHILSLLLISVSVLGCKTLEPIQAGSNGEQIHTYSQVAYPPNLGAFQRGEYHVYDSNGKDISFAYDLVSLKDQVYATIYSFPAPKLVSIGSRKEVVNTARRLLFKDYVAAEIQNIMGSHQPAELTECKAIENQIGTSEIDGVYAQFKYEELVGISTRNVLSELYVFQKDKWLIKYRITYPSEIEEKAKQLIEQLMQDHIDSQPEA